MSRDYDAYVERYNVDEELTHYGIKGMKWGVRKKRNSDTVGSDDFNEVSALKTRQPKTMSNDELQKIAKRTELENKTTANSATSTKYVKPKAVKELSDKELQAKLNRIRMETEYGKLTKEQNAGREFMSKLAADVFKTVLTDLVMDAAKSGASAAYSRATGQNGSAQQPSSPTVTTAIQLMPVIRKALTS
jgi:hypothetical protein